MSEAFASGSWTVAAGNEEAFVARWTEFLEWTQAENAGFQYARLLQDTANPRHYISLARWDDAATRGAWKARPEFAQRMGACRALCDDMQGADYDSAVEIG